MKAGAVINGARGRFVGTAELTPQQLAAAVEYANGEKLAVACKLAGYEYPDQEAQRLKANPRLRRHARRLQERNGFELVAAGVKAWRRVAEDLGTPPADVIRAGEKLVEVGFRLLDAAKASEAEAVGAIPLGIPDGSGRGEMGGIEALFAAFRMMPGDGAVTVDAQPIDIKQ